jgi:2-polyprenyl-3-methyl-5-hydroxy-6-metoxy-1,4-benzoquinol methylase
MAIAAIEAEAELRFPFGANWRRFLADIDDERIEAATNSLKHMLCVPHLHGKTFLDVGSGSGLFSLAARRLGASVSSFDYDRDSVACTAELKRRFFPNDAQWVVQSGSALDSDFVASLGSFDVVYSWGVLHHTGDMKRAFATVLPAVAPGGQLFIALYNDQGWISRYWTTVKRMYNRNRLNRIALIALHTPYLIGLRYMVRLASGRGRLERGMSLWRDMIDWLGGYPFEVSRPEEVFDYFRQRGFRLENLMTCGGRMGCNEFVFRRER